MLNPHCLLCLVALLLLTKIIKAKLCSAHIHCAQKPLETANNFADNQKLLLIIKIGNRSNAADT